MIRVENIENSLSKISECGGIIVSDVTISKAGAKRALFADPDSNILGLIETPKK